jgi:hypothetical protein
MIRKFVDVVLQKKLNAKLSEDKIIEKAAKKFDIDINNPIEKLTLTITYRNVYITKFYCSFIAFITTFVLTIFVFPII